MDYIILHNGVHLWGAKEASLGAIPQEVISARTAAYKLNTLETQPGWKLVESDAVSVRGDVPDEALQTIAATAEELERMLYRELEGQERLKPYKIRIFDRIKDFCSYARMCGAANALSLYNPSSEEMGLHFGEGIKWDDFEVVFAHEFVHAWMDYVHRTTGPLWFAEGMAEYFSRVEWTGEGYRPTGQNPGAMKFLRYFEVLPLRQFISLPRDEMYGIKFNVYYAEAWALVSFLIKRYPNLVSDLLTVKIGDITHLEGEFSEYLDELLAQHS